MPRHKHQFKDWAVAILNVTVAKLNVTVSILNVTLAKLNVTVSMLKDTVAIINVTVAKLYYFSYTAC